MTILKAMNLKTRLRSNGTSGPFYGKPIDTEEALETTHRLVDYFDALKRNSSRIPIKPSIDLDYLLRCNRIASHYYTYINLQLSGITYKRSCLTDKEVVYVWLFAHNQPSDKPLITLGNIHLKISQNESKKN